VRGSWWKDEIPTGLQELRVRGRDTKGNVGDPILMTIDIGTWFDLTVVLGLWTAD
jgi:hypothetical protein